MDVELIKFEKIITINNYSTEDIKRFVHMLFICMDETNNKHNCITQFLNMTLKDSQRSSFAKDLKLEWACVKND